MSKKAIITNVTITETTYTATYSSGTVKKGSLDKIPRTVQAWIEKHQTTETEQEPETITELFDSSLIEELKKYYQIETGNDYIKVIDDNGDVINWIYGNGMLKGLVESLKAFEDVPVIDTVTGETISDNAAGLIQIKPTATENRLTQNQPNYGGFIWDTTTIIILPLMGAMLTGTAETIRLLSWICFQLAKLAGWIQPKAKKAAESIKSYTAKTADKIKEVAPVIISQMRQTAESLKAWTATAMQYRAETMTEDFTTILK